MALVLEPLIPGGRTSAKPPLRSGSIAVPARATRIPVVRLADERVGASHPFRRSPARRLYMFTRVTPKHLLQLRASLRSRLGARRAKTPAALGDYGWPDFDAVGERRMRPDGPDRRTASAISSSGRPPCARPDQVAESCAFVRSPSRSRRPRNRGSWSASSSDSRAVTRSTSSVDDRARAPLSHSFTRSILRSHRGDPGPACACSSAAASRRRRPRPVGSGPSGAVGGR